MRGDHDADGACQVVLEGRQHSIEPAITQDAACQMEDKGWPDALKCGTNHIQICQVEADPLCVIPSGDIVQIGPANPRSQPTETSTQMSSNETAGAGHQDRASLKSRIRTPAHLCHPQDPLSHIRKSAVRCLINRITPANLLLFLSAETGIHLGTACFASTCDKPDGVMRRHYCGLPR